MWYVYLSPSHTHTHTHTEYYSAIKKEENVPFATKLMDLEGIILTEISQTEKDKYYMISHVDSNNNKKPTSNSKKKDEICGCQRWG